MDFVRMFWHGFFQTALTFLLEGKEGVPEHLETGFIGENNFGPVLISMCYCPFDTIFFVSISEDRHILWLDSIIPQSVCNAVDGAGRNIEVWVCCLEGGIEFSTCGKFIFGY
jgi:hypothetical protein